MNLIILNDDWDPLSEGFVVQILERIGIPVLCKLEGVDSEDSLPEPVLDLWFIHLPTKSDNALLLGGPYPACPYPRLLS